MTLLADVRPARPMPPPPRARDDRGPILVLGAGPCGLVAADCLAAHGRDVLVLEEQPFIGGAAASVSFGEFTCDFGPHAYHVKGDRIDELVRQVAGEPLAEKQIDQKLVIGRKLLAYPLVLGEVVRHLHPLFVLRGMFDFLVSNLVYRIFNVPDDSFERWGIKRFGFALYHLCFGQYTQRVWGVHPSQISPRLASQKLHKLSLVDLTLKLLGFRGQDQATYWRRFYYPERGIGAVWHGLRRRLEAAGGRVLCGAEVIQLQRDEDRIVTVHYRLNGGVVRQPCSAVVSTLPVGRLADMLRPAISPDVSLAARDMKYRCIIVVNLVFDCPSVIPHHWIYLLDPRFRFNRFSEQKNLGRLCAPPGRTTLAFELTCNMEDGVWLADDDVLKARALEEAAKYPGLPLDKVVACHVQRMKRAYPMYDLEFERRLRTILHGLAGVSNLWSTGRHGLFLNCDMHDTMEMGLNLAENLVSQQPRSPAEYYAQVTGYLSRKMSAVKA